MFGIQGAESFQAEYQRLVETWLRKFTELEEKIENNKEKAEQNSEFKDLGEKKDKKEAQKIEVRDKDDNLLYGELEGKRVCTLTPEQMQKLDEASNFSPGNVLEELPSLRIEVDGETLFQSGNEEILINKKLNNVEVETFSEPSHEPGQPEKEVQVDYDNYEDYGYPPEADYYSDYSGDYSLEPEPFEQDYYPDENGGESPRQSKSLIDDKINDILVELMVPIIEAMPAVQPEPKELQSENSFVDLLQPSAQLQQEEETIKSSSLNSEPTQKTQLTPEILSSESPSAQDVLAQVQAEQKSGLNAGQEVVQEALKDVPEGYLKSESPSAQEVLAQVQAEQKKGLDAVQEALKGVPEGSLKSVLQGMVTDMQTTAAQQQSDPAMDKLMKQRFQQPNNPHWWQKLSTKVEQMVTSVRDNFTQHRAASTLKEFANRIGLQPGESYQGAEYNLSREGKDYTLTNKQGHELLKFQSSVLGVKVDKRLQPLDNSHFKKTEQLRQDFKENKQHSGAFISEGAAEAKNFWRINRLTMALIQYAAVQGGTAKVEGKFSYDWQANAAGNVLIQDKQGNALLAVSQGHMRSRLTEKDFQHFEQMLPALQNSAGSSRQPTASKGKQVER